MIRYLVYFFPIAVNYILGGVFFMTAYRFSEANAGGFIVGLSLSVWALAFSVTSLWISRKTTAQSAQKWLMTAAVSLTILSLCFLIFDALYLQFLWVVLTGIAAAVYCVPFQIYMKEIDPNPSAGIVRASSLYTFTWSFGMATGPFIFRQVTQQTGYALNALLALLMAISIPLIDRWNRNHPPAPSRKKNRVQVDYSGKPDFARVGWVIAGTGVLSIAMLRAMEPYRGQKLGFPLEDIAGAMALVSYVQAFTALSFFRSRTWMYRLTPALLAGLSGGLALLFFGFGTQVWCFYLAAVLYGLYSGCFYFYAVFYALVHPKKAAKYVGINELIVGITSVFGPLFGGMLVWGEQSFLPFFAAAMLTAGATVYHVSSLRKKQ